MLMTFNNNEIIYDITTTLLPLLNTQIFCLMHVMLSLYVTLIEKFYKF